MRSNRINSLFFASFFATAATAALVAAPAAAQQPYDGLWQVTVVTKTGSCDSLASPQVLPLGSFTHVTEKEEQLAVLRAARALAPNAPLGLSFFLRKPDVPSRSRRLRHMIRGALQHAGGASKIDPGLGYDSGGGFVYSYTMEEISDLASNTGYRIGISEDQSFPYVVLLPS